MADYRVIVGMYDHKLGPICAGPNQNCKWLKTFGNAASLIRDGLNTKSERLLINYERIRIQAFKFAIEDSRLRGGTCRCCLFVMVPPKYPLIPDSFIDEIIRGFKEVSLNNDNNPKSAHCGKYLYTWQQRINDELVGDIGEAQTEHKARNFATVIKGYAQILEQGIKSNDEKHKEYLKYISRFTDNIIKLYSKT